MKVKLLNKNKTDRMKDDNEGDAQYGRKIIKGQSE